MDHPIHGSGDRRQALSSRSPGLSPASVSFFFLARGREALLQRSPEIREAVRHRTDQILRWMKRGGPWRAFLVSTVSLSCHSFLSLFSVCMGIAFGIPFYISRLCTFCICLEGSVQGPG